MKKEEIFKSYQDWIMPTYTKMPLIFVKGKGMKLVDIDGREYLDFFSGWGVANVGHCHSAVMSAVRDQVSKLIHLPNNYFHPGQAKLARELIRWTFPGKVFFCNSGAEANEGAIKLARAYGSQFKDRPKFEIITFQNAFHGRTLATVTATGQKKYQEGFEPLVEGFKTNIPLNDFEAVLSAVTDRTAGILFEVVQGEGGINLANKDFVRKLRKLCDDKKMLLIIDEVQTGMGRTGKMFGFQNYDIVPDVITLAKSLGGGLPIGCMIARNEIADTLQPGKHASTFGGSPLVCKASIGVFKAIQKDKMLANVAKMSPYIFEKLKKLQAKFDVIKEVRGIGLMIGVELNAKGKEVVDHCASCGLLINCTHDTVLRLMPALNVTKRQIDSALRILEAVLRRISHAS
jgi:acetylornithine/N-succinyldiaminopimelate aminotransferase